jgi:hypothetical protein
MGVVLYDKTAAYLPNIYFTRRVAVEILVGADG